MRRLIRKYLRPQTYTNALTEVACHSAILSGIDLAVVSLLSSSAAPVVIIVVVVTDHEAVDVMAMQQAEQKQQLHTFLY